jgi:DNA-binding beta-propeller fold protein YncE
MTLNASGSRLYVSNRHDEFVHIHDTATGNRLNSLKVRSPTGLAFNPGETRLYALSGSVITRINPAGNGSLIGDIPGTDSPLDIVFSPHNISTPHAYITDYNAHTVIIVDATADRIHKTLTGFNRPFGIAMNPITPRAYVTQYGGNVLTLINTDTQTVISSLGGFSGPADVAVTPNGLWAYVANFGSNTVSVVAL